MKNIRNDRFLVIDLEMTCWEGKPPEDTKSEIIEIGLVEADSASMAELRAARYLVRPVHSAISPYCTALTGISDGDVRIQGRPFAESLRSLARDFSPTYKRLVTWGGDWQVLDDQCRRDGAANPFPRDNVIDLGSLVSLARGKSDRMGLSAALAHYGLEFDGTPHGAVDDSRNTLRLFGEIARRMDFGGPSSTFPGP